MLKAVVLSTPIQVGKIVNQFIVSLIVLKKNGAVFSYLDKGAVSVPSRQCFSFFFSFTLVVS